MIVDTSVVMSIILDESDAAGWIAVLKESAPHEMSVATYVELAVVAMHLDKRLVAQLPRLLAGLGIALAPVDADQAKLAIQGLREFGSGSLAKLNYGDSFSYALAMQRLQPLAFKGNNFSHTDVLQVPHSTSI